MDTEPQAYNEFVIRNPFHTFLIVSALVISRNFLNAFGASSLKALANGFNICFNILSILLNGNVKSVCHPLSTLLKRVERMLNRCSKSLKAFKLSFNMLSTFLLFSGMFGMLKRSWRHLPRSFNIVDQVHAQLRRRNHGHHGWKDGNKARQFCVWLIVRNNFISTKSLFTSNILFDVAQYSLKITMTHSHHIFIFRRVFDRQLFHDVVEIAPFIPSPDPLPCLSPPAFFIFIIQNFESYKNCW